MSIFKKVNHISSFQIITIGFLSVILIGALFLMLPVSTAGTGNASFIDALFTATSATCVTGLVTCDTATYWSLFGQIVILILIQIGGMGVVTIAIAFSVLSKKKIGLMQRNIMQDAISAPQVGGIVRMTIFILRTTILLELIGAVMLSFSFCKSVGTVKGIWYSVFHSVSAFCNAGFDLFGIREPFSSLTSFSSDALVNTVIMFLIIMGGIGFLTWDDVKTHKFKFHKYRLQTKVVLSATFFLITLPALYLYIFEFRELPFKERILAAFFQSVTLRTAGFNTADLTKVSDAGQFLMILLMLIGGSPTSTAGGMKITTIVVLFTSAVAVFRHWEEPHIFNREIPVEAIKNAAAILLLYAVLFFSGGILICAIDGVPLLTAFFEAASAIGTVGITLGITPSLGTVSHIIIIFLMFFGRVGGLTLIFAALFPKKGANINKYPEEAITVG